MFQYGQMPHEPPIVLRHIIYISIPVNSAIFWTAGAGLQHHLKEDLVIGAFGHAYVVAAQPTLRRVSATYTMTIRGAHDLNYLDWATKTDGLAREESFDRTRCSSEERVKNDCL